MAIESDLADSFEAFEAVDAFRGSEGVAVAAVIVAGLTEAFLAGMGMAGCRLGFLCCCNGGC